MTTAIRQGYLLRWALLTLSVAGTLHACALADEIEENGRRVVCEQLEDLSPTEMDAIFEGALSVLAQNGVTVDAAWTDPARFDQYVTTAYDLAGCSAGSYGQAAQPFHDGSNPMWCGPGHHHVGVVPISECLNAACYVHDSCYARCDSPSARKCMWGPPHDPCDDAFFVTANACHNPFGTKFASAMVRFLARRLDDIGFTSGCALGMTCPEPHVVGAGPCALEVDGLDCHSCLAEMDPNAACLQTACGGNLADYICYTASCGEVAPCYGGWWTGGGGQGGSAGAGGTGGGGAGGAGGVDPSSLWDVVVVDGLTPATNLGANWDVGAGAPDPFVTARVGSSNGTQTLPTNTAADTYAPYWNEYILQGVPAGSLKAYLEFEMRDEDVAFDDLIGGCAWQLSDGAFASSSLDPIGVTCEGTVSQGGYSLRFYVAPN